VEIEDQNLPAKEKVKLRQMIDEILHQHILTVIFDHLPAEFHQEFVTKFHAFPSSADLIPYLKGKSNKDIEQIIQNEADKIKKEIIAEIKSSR